MSNRDVHIERLFQEALTFRLSRRQIIRRGLSAGLSLTAIGLVLDACGSGTPSSAGPTTTTGGVGSGGGTAVPTSAASTSPATPGASATLPTGGIPVNGGDFTIVFPSTTADLDPQSAYDNQASCVFFGCYEMLLRLKGNSTVDYEPMLAKSWSPNADKSEWTFTLYPNVKFHDGTTCDANAVVKSFQRFYKMGRGPYNDIVRFVANPDTDITAVDSLNVKFKLRDAGLSTVFLADMASEYGPFVVSPTAVEQHKTAADPWAHNWFVNHIVGTGPYKATQVNPQNQIVLERFPDYYRGWSGNHFDRIVFRVVEDTSTRQSLIVGGSADALTNALTPQAVVELEGNKDLQIIKYPTTNVNWTWINCGDRLSDATVRKGLCYAFPYNEVRSSVYKGLISKTGGPLTPTTRGYDPKVFIYDTDLTKAKSMIATKVPGGTKLTGMIASGTEQAAQIAQLFQANLQQIGYQLTIQQVERSAQTNLAYGDAPASKRPDFFISWGWWPDYNDGYNEIYPNFDSASIGSAGADVGVYKNAQVDKALATVAPGVSTTEYNTQLALAQNALTEQDPPAMFWGTVLWYTIMRANIRGFQWNPIYLNSYYFYDMYRVK